MSQLWRSLSWIAFVSRKFRFQFSDAVLQAFNDRGDLAVGIALVNMLRTVDVPGFNVEQNGTLDLADIVGVVKTLVQFASLPSMTSARPQTLIRWRFT